MGSCTTPSKQPLPPWPQDFLSVTSTWYTLYSSCQLASQLFSLPSSKLLQVLPSLQLCILLITLSRILTLSVCLSVCLSSLSHAHLPSLPFSSLFCSCFSHGQAQSGSHVQHTNFSLCSGLFQITPVVFSLISTIKTFSLTIPWSGCVVILYGLYS